MVGGHKFYDRKEIKDILAYFNVMANPQDSMSFERIVNSPKRGIGPGSVENYEILLRCTRMATARSGSKC